MRSRLTYANVMSTIAVCIAIGGTSYAAIELPANSVGSKQLKAGAVSNADVKRESLKASAFKSGELPDALSGTVFRTHPIPSAAPPGPSSATARCEPGEIVVGGGFTGAVEAETEVIGSAPVGPSPGDPYTQGWSVSIEPRGDNKPTGPYVVYAVCLK